jgi:hypothetical protein
MSYAGPVNPKIPGKPVTTIKRVATTPASHTERNAAFLVGVLVGAAVGAGVALLLAPHSGRSTRRRIVRSGRKLTQRSRDAWHDRADELHDMRRRRRRPHAGGDAATAPTDGGQRRSFSLRAASSL